MTPKQLTGLLLAGVLAGIISLPTTWVTFHPAKGGPVSFVDWIGFTLGDPTITVTGFTGHTFIPCDVPLWVIVSISIGAAALRLMQLQNSSTFALPMVKGIAMIGAIWVTVVFLLMLVGERDSVGIGGFLALICAAISVVGSYHQSKSLTSPCA